MLSAALFVGCNNESVVNPDVIVDPNSEEVVEGVSTHATFQLSFPQVGTYSGSSDLPGVGNESDIYDVALFIYKLSGEPEAYGYVSGGGTAITGGKEITLRCYSGAKLIYLAANANKGATSPIIDLVQAGMDAGSTTSPGYLGTDWTATGVNPVYFSALNATLWSTGAATAAVSPVVNAVPPAIPAGPSDAIPSTLPVASASSPAKADGLIAALANYGDPAGSNINATTGSNVKILLTNWGDNVSQPDDAGSILYHATVKFTLKPTISATDSQTPAGDETNANGKNALKINVQRALAKVRLTGIVGQTSGTVSGVGTAPSNVGSDTLDNRGNFVIGASSKWAYGNIPVAEYPFQQWDGARLKSPLYDSIGAIPVASAVNPNVNWARLLDNSRWVWSGVSPAAQSYVAQDLTVQQTFAQIAAVAANKVIGNDYIYVPENSNKITYQNYTSFVVFAGEYKPNRYVTAVNSVGDKTYVTGSPAATPNWTADDTLYYIQTTDTTGVFIHGYNALKQYVGWSGVLGYRTPATWDPATTPVAPAEVTAYNAIITYINGLRDVAGNVAAKLQAYYQGQCFYRVYINDLTATNGTNTRAVRRNHIYSIAITKIKGPGIADPNDIIDPHPEEPEPLEEAETWVTATISVNNWHVVSQNSETGLNQN
jgi:hypothetical protein